MKKSLLYFLFLFTIPFYAQVSDIEHCSGDTFFNLTNQKALLIGNLNPAETTVSYYLSLADATNNTNAIANPADFKSTDASKTIYARIDNKGTITTNYFNLVLSPSLDSIVTISQTNCVNDKGTITVNATGGKKPYQYSIGNGYQSNNIFADLVPGTYQIITKDALGCAVEINVIIENFAPINISISVTSVSCYGSSDGAISVTATGGTGSYSYSLKNNNGIIIDFQTNNVFTNLSAGDYTVEVRDAGGCIVMNQIFITEPTPLSAIVNVENKTITISATGGSLEYSYSLDGIVFQSSNVFTNLPYGNYQVFIKDSNACIYMQSTTLNPPTPLIDGKNAITLNFTPGQTLADIIVDGQNIKWYSNKTASTNKTSKTTETPLPLTTVLIDGTTYYASQTIDGIESTDRLAVTAKSNGSLSTSDFVMPDFKFYPNPVHNILKLSNTSILDEIEIFSVSGKSVLAKNPNNLNYQIDLSNVSTGMYFLKIKSEEQVKIIKIVKNKLSNQQRISHKLSEILFYKI